MRDYRTTAIVCAPTYAAQLWEVMNERDISPAELSLSKGLFGAEPWSEKFRQEIEDNLVISVTDNYGITEIIGPGVSYECDRKDGLHIAEDHFIPEVIDADSGKILEPGQKGELVLTTITKEAFPLIRYRTGDISSLNYEKCSCGRTFVRMNRVFERLDDMIIFNGQNMFPSQFEQILTEVIGTIPKFQLVIDQRDNLDTMEILLEVSGEIFFDEMGKLTDLEFQIVNKIKERLDIIPGVKLVEPRTLKGNLKKRRVIDKRFKAQ
jgi:phenylacetate-CoA ligase